MAFISMLIYIFADENENISIMKIFNKYTLLVLIMSIMAILPSYSQWYPSTQKFVSNKYNIQWDLSGFGEWTIAQTSQLPENMIFCGKLQDEGIVVSLLAFDEDGTVSDIWENSNEFIDGFVSSLVKQATTFPGIRAGEVKYEKCYLLYKKALKFGVPVIVYDDRLKSNSLAFLYCGYVFVKGQSAIIGLLTIPGIYVDQYGEEIFDDIFSGLMYIDIRKEQKN